jgi:lipoyl(octanoyl) transferase
MIVKPLGRCDYAAIYAAMRAFTEARTAGTSDELWLCEHDPVFTQGLAGKAEHVIDANGVPVIATNRGGQVTYHGPGQVVAYPLIDLRRCNAGRGIYVKEYVFRLESALLQTLEGYGITGERVAGAPGIYVRFEGDTRQPKRDINDALNGLAKIAALGVKVSHHNTYHGVALNVAMDLQPFSWINPCGYTGLRTLDLATLGVQTTWSEAAGRLAERLQAHLS